MVKFEGQHFCRNFQSDFLQVPSRARSNMSISSKSSCRITLSRVIDLSKLSHRKRPHCFSCVAVAPRSLHRGVSPTVGNCAKSPTAITFKPPNASDLFPVICLSLSSM